MLLIILSVCIFVPPSAHDRQNTILFLGNLRVGAMAQTKSGLQLLLDALHKLVGASRQAKYTPPQGLLVCGLLVFDGTVYGFENLWTEISITVTVCILRFPHSYCHEWVQCRASQRLFTKTRDVACDSKHYSSSIETVLVPWQCQNA